MRCHAALPLCLGLIAGVALGADQTTTPRKANRQSEDQFQRFLKMKPEDRDKFLQNLPPQRRQNIERQLRDFQKMAPAGRTRVLTELEMLRSLPLEKQQQVRRSLRQLSELPEERKALVRKELQLMAPMPDEQRREHMNSEEFRNRYSVTEQQMMSNLSQVTPPPNGRTAQCWCVCGCV
jgi:hypothetical protein